MPLTASSAIESRKFRDSPKPMMLRPKSATLRSSVAPGPPERGKVGQDQRHQHRSHRGGRPQNAQSLGTHMENLGGKDRQQGHRPPEEHREQIEGERAQHHRLAAHEPDPGGETLQE